jgi:hypothetical protein
MLSRAPQQHMQPPISETRLSAANFTNFVRNGLSVRLLA